MRKMKIFKSQAYVSGDPEESYKELQNRVNDWLETMGQGIEITQAMQNFSPVN